jgi:hypothetical protein
VHGRTTPGTVKAHLNVGFLNGRHQENERVHIGEFEQLLDARARSRDNHAQAFRLTPVASGSWSDRK